MKKTIRITLRITLALIALFLGLCFAALPVFTLAACNGWTIQGGAAVGAIVSGNVTGFMGIMVMDRPLKWCIGKIDKI